jgi:hypothetical protein
MVSLPRGSVGVVEAGRLCGSAAADIDSHVAAPMATSALPWVDRGIVGNEISLLLGVSRRDGLS